MHDQSMKEADPKIFRRGTASARRAAILANSLSGGGAERVALHVAAGLLERGHEVDLLLCRLVCHYPDQVPEGCRLFFLLDRGDSETQANLGRIAVAPRPLAPELRRWRVCRSWIAFAGVTPRRQWPHLVKMKTFLWARGVAAYLDRERPNALLTISTSPTVAATMAARLARRPVRVVATLHNKFRSGRVARRAYSYAYADAAVGVSHGASTQLAGIPGMARDRVHTVYNPVDSAELARKAREAIDHPWLDGSGPPVILAIGRLSAQKDFSTLLAAFAHLLARRPARLIVLGQGHLRSRLQSRARRLRVSEHVDFHGFAENPYAFLARVNLFVLSSRREGLSVVLIEAMACGCPVVSTDCEFGPNEILENGRWGELVPVGDAKALAEAMARALDRPPDRDALRERAAWFSVERALDRYEELLVGGT